jgi:hypothetical protein
VGYEVEARTGFGGLEVDLPEFTILEQDRQFGRRMLRGQSAGLADKERILHLVARTTNGSIRVMQRLAGDVWDDDDRPAPADQDEERVISEDRSGGPDTPEQEASRAK